MGKTYEKEESQLSPKHDLPLAIDSIPTLVWSARPDGSIDFLNQRWIDYTGLSLEQIQGWDWINTDIIHPEDLKDSIATWQKILASGELGEVEARMRSRNKEYRWFLFRSVPERDKDGNIVKWFGTCTDIHDRKQAEEKLRLSEAYFAEAQRLSQTGSFSWCVSTGEINWSKEVYRIYEFDPNLSPTFEFVFQRIHPEEREYFHQIVESAAKDARDLDFEHRLLMADGSLKCLHVVAHAFSDKSGNLSYVGAVMDVTAVKKAQERIRQDEREFRQIVEAIPELIVILSPDGSFLYANQLVVDYTGLTLEDLRTNDFRTKIFHPEDLERFRSRRQEGLSKGMPFEMEERALRKDGQYRWFLVRFNPFKDEAGNIIRWYATGMDIDDRRRAEERVKKENIALREEIDKTSMFEEIIGTSSTLQTVLTSVGKVAPTDSTVLITGETGTGKELVARAIHKRSQRASRAFVTVNCAAIPPSLIASELFGHEKGAFTGALQRHLGRFELAEGGTILLDEIGELPVETQLVLLRVLQEREFERVGGRGPIRSDVRVLAATNHDLQTSISAGKFRSDLFYRLNVFPIEIPPLRERKEDILLLVEYFIDRFSSNAGKKFRGISRKTTKLLEEYPWPGNIRELQNVIERALILSEGDALICPEHILLSEKTSSASR